MEAHTSRRSTAICLTALALLCVLPTGCGTTSDYGSRGGPHIYGGVAHSGRAIWQRGSHGSLFGVALAVIDLPLSFVCDTVLLPVSIAKASSAVDPVEENERIIEEMAQKLAKQLLEQAGDQDTIAVLAVTGTGRDAAFADRLSLAVCAALTESGRVGTLIKPDQVQEMLNEIGLTSVDDPLVVRSVLQELKADALIATTYKLVGFDLTLSASLRTVAEGLEEAKSSAADKLLSELE